MFFPGGDFSKAKSLSWTHRHLILFVLDPVLSTASSLAPRGEVRLCGVRGRVGRRGVEAPDLVGIETRSVRRIRSDVAMLRS